MVAVSPVMALVNVPMPVPFIVLVDKATVGFAVVLQQTPRAVTAAPPSLLILPPLAAVVDVMEVTAVVVMAGKVAIMFSGLSSFWQLNASSDSRIMIDKVFIQLFLAG